MTQSARARFPLVLAAAIPACLFGQTVVYGPLVSNITHSTARVTFTTDAVPRKSAVEYSIPGGGVSLADAKVNPDGPIASFAVLVGLTPATTYQVRASVNDGAAVSNPVTFTTLPEPAVHPELPAEPAAVDSAMPAGAYGDSSSLAVAQDCSNIGDVLDRLAKLDGDLNYEVVIPAGTACRGRFVFPPRPAHNGWVIVRSSAAGTPQLPDEGVRMTPDWRDGAARFITNILPTYGYNQPQSVPDVPCEKGAGENGLYWTTLVPASVFPLLRCSSAYESYSGATAVTNITGNGSMTATIPGHRLNVGDVIKISENGYVYTIQARVSAVNGDDVSFGPAYRLPGKPAFNPALNPQVTRNDNWRTVEHREGTALPDSCQAQEWFYNPAAGSVYWCVSPNQWLRFEGDTLSRNPAISVPREARRYRFIGLEVTHQPMPDPFPTGWEKPVAGNAYQGTVRELIESQADEVIWDRCYIHGLPYPQRLFYGMEWEGNSIGVVDSYIDEVAWWRQGPASDLQGSIGILHASGGPAVVHNNFIAAAGMSYFAPENGKLTHDVTLSRNHFQVYRKWRHGDWENNGMVYTNRNPFELKKGWVYKLEGNVFEFNYSNLTAAPFVLLTPRCARLPGPVGLVSGSDGTITTAAPADYEQGDVIAITGTGSLYDGLWEVASSGCPGNCSQFTLLHAPQGTTGAGTATLLARNAGIRDVLLRWNWFLTGTELLRMSGTDGACTYSSIPPTSRVALIYNDSRDLNTSSFANGGNTDIDGLYGPSGNFGAHIVYNQGFAEDLIVRDSRFILNRGKMPLLLLSEQRSEGLDFSNNVFTFDEQLPFSAVYHTGVSGTEALNRGYGRDGNPSWTFDNNAICCGQGANAPQYPPSTMWPDSLAGLAKLRLGRTPVLNAGMRPVLPFSMAALHAAGAEDPEIELAGKQGRVLNAAVKEVGSDWARLQYLAPDEKACKVEFGPSPVWGSGRRVNDGGGSRQRSVHLTGLPSGAVTHYRILCASEHPSGTLATR